MMGVQDGGMKNPARLGTALLLGSLACSQDGSAILTKLPANAVNVIVLRDTVAAVERLLGSVQVDELLSSTRGLQEVYLGTTFDARSLLRQLRLFSADVPVSAALAIDDAGMTTVFDALLALQSLEAIQLLRGEPEAGGAHMDVLRAPLRRLLSGYREPAISLIVQMRDVRTAEAWFERAKDMAESLLGDESGMMLKAADDSLRLVVDLRKFADGAIPSTLADLGVPMPREHAPKMTLQLDVSGSELTLRVGNPAKGPLAEKTLGADWVPGPEQLGFLKMGSVRATAAWSDFDRNLKKAGPLPESLDKWYEDFDLARFFMTSAGRSLTGRFDFGESMSYSLAVGIPDLAEINAIPDRRLLRCIRPQDGPFELSWESLPERMLSKWGGNSAMKEPPMVEIGAALALVREKFAPGTCAVFRRAEYRGSRDLGWGAMPFGAMALVGMVKKAEEATGMLDDFSRGIRWRDRQVFEKLDMGLGVTTYSISKAAFPPFLWDGADADWSPHVALFENFVIVSTHLGYSQELLGRLKSNSVIPTPAKGVASWAFIDGVQFGAVADGMLFWSQQLGALPREQQPPMLGDRISSLLQRCEYWTAVEGDHLVTRCEIQLRLTPKTR